MASSKLTLGIIAAATAFAPSPRLTIAGGAANTFALSPTRRRPIAHIVPPKVAEFGAYGLAAYGAVELCWWGLPIGYALRICDVLTVDAFFEVAKAPLCAALILWPNSWFRNGVACRLAAALRDAAAAAGR